MRPIAQAVNGRDGTQECLATLRAQVALDAAPIPLAPFPPRGKGQKQGLGRERAEHNTRLLALVAASSFIWHRAA